MCVTVFTDRIILNQASWFSRRPPQRTAGPDEGLFIRTRLILNLHYCPLVQLARYGFTTELTSTFQFSKLVQSDAHTMGRTQCALTRTQCTQVHHTSCVSALVRPTALCSICYDTQLTWTGGRTVVDVR